MNQTEIFIVGQALWDFFLIIVACGFTAYGLVLLLLVWSDEPLNPESDNLFTRLILRCRTLRDLNRK